MGLLLAAIGLAGLVMAEAAVVDRAVVDPGVVAAVMPATEPADVSIDGAARLVAIEPCRLLDTRREGGPLDAGEAIEIPVIGRCEVPVEAVAVAVTLSSILPTEPGWLSVHPAGSPWPGTSTLNLDADEVRANGTIVALGAAGGLEVLSSVGGHVLLDVSAAFVPATTATSGRFVAAEQIRLVDTRLSRRPEPQSWTRVPRPTPVPVDATAVVLTVTAIDAPAPGFVSARPAVGGTARGTASEAAPDTSIQNLDSEGQTRAATVIVPLGPEGVEVFTWAGDHLAVDLSGWFTGETADETSDGLFVALDPVRLADSRLDGGRLRPGGSRAWPVAAHTNAVVANLTVTDVRQGGWIVAHPARTDLPEVSSVNAAAGETAANLAIVPVSGAGLQVQAPIGADVVIDVTGRFLGEPLAIEGAEPSNEWAGVGRTLLVTDSIGASLRMIGIADTPLAVFDLVVDLRECRRTLPPSCSYLGRRPPSALEVIRAPGLGPVDTVVLITGYNDSPAAFARGVDLVVEAARSAGAERVVWLTLRADRPQFAEINRLLEAAAERHHDLRLLDWNRHTADRPEWISSDRIHLSVTGARALAAFLADGLAALD